MSRLAGTLALLAASALAPDLEVDVEPRRLTVGDRAALTVSLRLPDDLPSGAVSWPEWNGAVGDLEILSVGPVETIALDAGDRLLVQTLEVTAFEVGEAVLPPVEVGVALPAGRRTLTSSAIPVEVVSVLPKGEAEPQVKPPAPPQRLSLGERFWWSSGALLATGLVALALLMRQSRRLVTPEATLPSRSPREELDDSLAALRSETDTAALHAGLSMSARRFLGRTLDFAAPESTTSEIRRTLSRRGLDAGLVASAGALLTDCDMVKFARRDVQLERGRRRIDDLSSLADGVESWLRPIEAPVEEGD